MRYDSSIGLPSNVVHRIEEDEKGLFWITTNKGLVHFNPKTLEFKVYTIANGLLSNQLIISPVTRTRMDGYTLVVLMVLFLSNRLFLLTMIFSLLW